MDVYNWPFEMGVNVARGAYGIDPGPIVLHSNNYGLVVVALKPITKKWFWVVK